MGDALECERSIDAQGDTQQKTTTGLAYYLSQLNTACFTTGWDHWALTSQGVVEWASDDGPTHPPAPRSHHRQPFRPLTRSPGVGISDPLVGRLDLGPGRSRRTRCWGGNESGEP